MSKDDSEALNLPDKALIDNVTLSSNTDVPDKALIDSTTLSSVTDDETLTTFEEILRHERGWTPGDVSDESCRSARDETSEVLWETHACLLRTNANLREFAEDTTNTIGYYAEEARSKVYTHVDKFFSEEQTKARENMASKIVSALKSSLNSCHDFVDQFLIKIFDTPVIEEHFKKVEKARAAALALNDTLSTIDTEDERLPLKRDKESNYKKPRTYDNEAFLVPLEEEKIQPRTSRDTLVAEKQDDCVAGDAPALLTFSSSDSLGLQGISSAGTDESVQRFKESLYLMNGFDSRNVIQNTALLDEKKSSPVKSYDLLQEYNEVTESDKTKEILSPGASYDLLQHYEDFIGPESAKESLIEIASHFADSVDTPLTSNTSNTSFSQRMERRSRINAGNGAREEEKQAPKRTLFKARKLRDFRRIDPLRSKAHIDPYSITESIASLRPRSVIDLSAGIESLKCIEVEERRDPIDSDRQRGPGSTVNEVIDLTMYDDTHL